MVKKVLYFIAILSLFSCERYNLINSFIPAGDVVESRFEQSMKMTDNKPYMQISSAAEYRFYVTSDTHVNQTTRNLTAFVEALRNDSSVLFGVLLGDCIDAKGSFPLFAHAVEYDVATQKYDYPIMMVLGNHDTYFGAWNEFKALIGPSVYYCVVNHDNGADLYIILDTATGTLGGKQMQWFKEFLQQSREQYRHCFVLTHSNLFNTDGSQGITGSMPLDETLELMETFRRYRVQAVLQGHDHHREDLYMEGVRYTIIPSFKDSEPHPQYLVVDVDDAGISYDWRTI